MENAVTERAPMHVWIVGGLATLWNAIGAIGYYVSRAHNVELMGKMAPGIDPQTAFAYADAMPIWASFGWGLGVWMGLLGSVLLLVRSRWSVYAFGLSLIGMALSFSYQFMVTRPPVGMDGKLMPMLVVVIGVFLFLYARAMAKKGILR
jgi:hypothetical protein